MIPLACAISFSLGVLSVVLAGEWERRKKRRVYSLPELCSAFETWLANETQERPFECSFDSLNYGDGKPFDASTDIVAYGNWSPGYLLNESSGTLTATFGTWKPDCPLTIPQDSTLPSESK